MTRDPPLDAADIQGIVTPGFFKPHQALLTFRLPPSERSNVVPVLLDLVRSNAIASCARTLDDRQRHRDGTGSTEDVLMALACTSSGLRALCNGLSATVPSSAFQAGMAARAGLLGDDASGGGTIGGSAVDFMLVVAGECKARVRAEAVRLQARLGDGEGLQLQVQFGDRLTVKSSREHFGFADGVSQPGIRGTWRGRHITRRRLPPGDPEHDLFGHPGQHLVWPGEFVLGYPASSPDPRLPGPVRPVPAWMHNGSFLVYRRLQQHVDVFEAEMARMAEDLRHLPGFAHMSPALLKAMLVGRWPSGAPVSRAPREDNQALGRERWMNNDFRFDDPAPLRTLPRTIAAGLRGLPPAPADILGQICPVASHIRKLNLRDQASDVGGASATQSRRILRVGVPYDDTATNGGKGLLFLSIQASIEDQFEFLQARWINSRVRPRGPGGNDMIVGRGARRCLIFGKDGAQAEVVAKEDFVTLTGGGYFFVPSLPTLRSLLQGALPPG